MNECQKSLQKSNITVEIPGFTAKEASDAFCLVCSYDKSYDPKAGVSKELVGKALGSRWPGLTKSVLGGIQHVISVDNAAAYAELWYKGGNWYAVTGADLKKSLGLSGGFYQIAGITKGMKLEKALPIFIETFFGKMTSKAAPCPCQNS